MADPRWPVYTVRYKTYLKEAIVEALRNAFDSHPDELLRNTKVTIDFPMTEADYPAVVVRFYGRTVNQAGVAHAEWLETFDTIARTPTFNDPFTEDSSTGYEIEAGEYPLEGIIDTTAAFLARPTAINISDRVEALAELKWNGEPVTVEHTIRSSATWNNLGLVCRCHVNVDPGKVDLEIYYRDDNGNLTLKSNFKFNMPVRTTGELMPLFVSARAVDDDVSLSLWTLNPGILGVSPVAQVSYRLSNNELVNLAGAGATWLRIVAGSLPAGWGAYLTTIDAYTINNLTATFAHSYRKFRHLVYTGDLEFAIYGLSTYDRDLIADSLVEILQMADLEPWTNELLKRIYEPEAEDEPADQEHYVNINTDTLSEYGESQQPVPWEAEDQLLYSSAFRMQVMGEFYSRVLPSPVFGVVDQVDLYPYMGFIGEPVPNPNPGDPQPWE